MTAAAGLLLTGGAARRLGVDKATLERGGERLVDRVAGALTVVADPVVEVGTGASALPCVREEPPGGGPLAAFAAGLAALAAAGCADRPVLLVAVDQPGCTAALLTLLRDHPGDGAVVPVAGGRHQPLCARYPAGIAATVTAALAAGERSLRALLDRVPVVEVPEAAWGTVVDADAFADLDRPVDLRRTGWAPPGGRGPAPSPR